MADGDAHQTPETGTSEPAKRPPSVGKTIATMLALMAVIVGAGLLVIYETGVLAPRTQERGAVGAPRPVPMPENCGAENADLKIEACVGGCITFVAAAIREAVEDWPDRVRAEFYAYESDEGQAFVGDHDEELACIFINGKNRFTLAQDGREKEVHLCGPPGENYTMRDLAAVLRQQWEEVYGEPPPEGFADNIEAFTKAGGRRPSGGPATRAGD